MKGILMSEVAPEHRRGRVVVAATFAFLLVLVAACSGSDNGSSDEPANASTTTARTSTSGTTGGDDEMPGGYVVFNGQGNNLDAYEPIPPFTTQRVITTIADDPNGLDINAQICFFPDGSGRFVAGEDTGQKEGDLQGWGIFQLDGRKVGDFSATQVAKLVPTYQGSSDNAENYGCGFLSDGRIVTTDVGNQALGDPDGQLIMWFPPYDSEQVAFCKIDIGIATAQSIWVDDQDRVYVASARPPTSGVWRYSGPWPTGPTAAEGCGKSDPTGAPLADEVRKEIFIPSGENLMISPSGLAATPTGTLYVSSVFTGVINEYDANGTFIRTILRPSAGEALGAQPFTTGTPLGIGVGPDGTLFYADIGLVSDGSSIGPGDGTGTVRRITFVDGQPRPPETMATGLAFPDGIGILTGGGGSSASKI
jgi:hypothetical protein